MASVAGGQSVSVPCCDPKRGSGCDTSPPPGHGWIRRIHREVPPLAASRCRHHIPGRGGNLNSFPTRRRDPSTTPMPSCGCGTAVGDDGPPCNGDFRRTPPSGTLSESRSRQQNIHFIERRARRTQACHKWRSRQPWDMLPGRFADGSFSPPRSPASWSGSGGTPSRRRRESGTIWSTEVTASLVWTPTTATASLCRIPVPGWTPAGSP